MSTSNAAYGFRIEGVECNAALALHGVRDWSTLYIERQLVDDPRAAPARLSDSDASIQTPAATLMLERATNRVLVRSAEPVPESDLVHPCLWPAAAVFARWSGAETLHAGAFLGADGGAWAVLGERGAGKSTLLAALALEGYEVLVDDLLVVRGGVCAAGPRCIDLRSEAIARLGLRRQTTPVRSTERRRLGLDPIVAEVPLRGLVYLAWGDRLELEPISPPEHLRLLTEHRRIRVLGAEVELLLDLAGLPAIRLKRPPSWAAIGAAKQALAGVPACV